MAVAVFERLMANLINDNAILSTLEAPVKQRVMCLILLLFLPALTWSQQKYWIFFRDKGLTEAQESTMKMQAKAAFSQHALERRAKMFPKNQ
ncbi:MAG: hypothetical protein ONB16_04450, partial [candidate division KSB1 bacterium]|nr:hypothetical protein [candidate division KSB1 bacterium]